MARARSDGPALLSQAVCRSETAQTCALHFAWMLRGSSARGTQPSTRQCPRARQGCGRIDPPAISRAPVAFRSRHGAARHGEETKALALTGGSRATKLAKEPGRECSRFEEGRNLRPKVRAAEPLFGPKERQCGRRNAEARQSAGQARYSRGRQARRRPALLGRTGKRRVGPTDCRPPGFTGPCDRERERIRRDANRHPRVSRRPPADMHQARTAANGLSHAEPTLVAQGGTREGSAAVWRAGAGLRASLEAAQR